jgi:homoaconitase/3-isopropylmalate dehydratase large subunit
MSQQYSSESELNLYLKSLDKNSDAEFKAVDDIIEGFGRESQYITSKDVILKLIEKLETETDVVMLDVYRNALEELLNHTPDALID